MTERDHRAKLAAHRSRAIDVAACYRRCVPEWPALAKWFERDAEAWTRRLAVDDPTRVYDDEGDREAADDRVAIVAMRVRLLHRELGDEACRPPASRIGPNATVRGIAYATSGALLAGAPPVRRAPVTVNELRESVLADPDYIPIERRPSSSCAFA